MSKQPERFFARILFKYEGKDGHEGRDICYIYNREALDEVIGLPKHQYDKSQFIEIGQELMLEGYRCRVVDINFKLYEQLNDMSGGYGINLLSPTDPTDYNCQVGVFVERIEE
ncbi:MAG TPA: hypothetical protein VF476_02865 [Chitinophagaceae bacterium]